MRRPRVGDLLSYEMGADKSGRPCAVRVLPEGFGGRFGFGSLILLSLLLALPVYTAHRLLEPDRAQLVYALSAVMSLVCFGVYYRDKQCARRGEWRVPESTLHFFELAGGWPGAFVAQRALRHKSSKFDFQATFWLILILYQVLSVDALRGWPLLQAVVNHFTSKT